MKAVVPVVFLLSLAGYAAAAAAAAPLTLESKIPLGDVSGRIDHLALDLSRDRLFVAELGNNSVGVVDLKSGKAVRQLTGIREPQGVAYLASADTLYVASGADGSLSLFEGADLKPGVRINLGGDADNIRADDQNNMVLVGYGGGGLASIENSAKTKVTSIKLDSHPEGFQLDAAASKIFVNLPSEGSVAVVDRTSGAVEAKWPLEGLQANYPMAQDAKNQRLLIATRQPSGLIVLQARQGDILQGEKPYGGIIYAGRTCGDADDLFVDEKRSRVYVICGQGVVDVFQYGSNGYQRIAEIRTVPGARTGLFSPTRDRLYLAVSRQPGVPPAIWVYQPN